ncbi:hypothetical protein EV138_3428 [Kribbella voronezhensis]|uniref:Uncharacterized protein n=1 Tax=Kribbella voronezhensis TaxID=2512212 RepID=A0A4R7TCM4_9ACTN|nr:hypothetical protein [Kribbella voronezhensis]TDU89851.1 hypothetical protein EV138_3428 [Kribbella voronezhensis]
MKDFPWGYVVGAAVTVIGLLLNQWRSDRREVDRWQKELDRDVEKWQREQAERQQQWEREDRSRIEQWKREDRRRWIDEQRTLYAASLRTARGLLDEIYSAEAQLAWVSDKEQIKAVISTFNSQLRHAEETFNDALSEVLIIASDEVLTKATALRDSLRAASIQARYYGTESGDRLSTARLQSKEDYDAYFRTVRADLGLSELPLSREDPEPDAA